jgi:hypothetical protein
VSVDPHPGEAVNQRAGGDLQLLQVRDPQLVIAMSSAARSARTAASAS